MHWLIAEQLTLQGEVPQLKLQVLPAHVHVSARQSAVQVEPALQLILQGETWQVKLQSAPALQSH